MQPANGTVFNAFDNLTIQPFVSDADGRIRMVEFFSGTTKLGESSMPPFFFTWTNVTLGTHVLTAKATDNSLSSTVSAAVTVYATNRLPNVFLVSPNDGASFLLPTNIVLEAVASDNDGGIAKVEFFSDGVRLGEDATAPYTFTWTNGPTGARSVTARATDRFQQTTFSAPITINISRSRYVAYIVAPGTVGGQNFGGSLGMDFDVIRPVVISALGVFDSAGDGIDPSSMLTAQLYSRSGNSGALLASLTFSNAGPGTLVNGSRFKPLASPLILSNGSYTIVGSGHNAANLNGNLCCNSKSWTTDDGGGLIAFVGASRYGTLPAAFPTTVDTGPVDRYAAATFEFLPLPSRPVILNGPANQLVRPGNSGVFSVSVVGDPPLRYQWIHDGTAILGASNAVLTVTNVQWSDRGSYTLIVSNAVDTAYSGSADLELLINPDIVQPPISQRVVVGSTVTLSTTVTNTANLPILYRWRTNGVYMNNAVFLLSNHTCFLTITNVRLPFTNYAVAVTNLARPSGILSAAALLTFVTDTDGDGLPDEWELSYGFSSTNALDRNLDADGDGQSNWQEYSAGTNPTNALSFLRIDSISAGSGALVGFGALSNKTYTLQWTLEPKASPWQDLISVPARPTNRTESIADPAAQSKRFYRLVTPANP